LVITAVVSGAIGTLFASAVDPGAVVWPLRRTVNG
jgi:hypothetical protein